MLFVVCILIVEFLLFFILSKQFFNKWLHWTNLRSFSSNFRCLSIKPPERYEMVLYETTKFYNRLQIEITIRATHLIIQTFVMRSSNDLVQVKILFRIALHKMMNFRKWNNKHRTFRWHLMRLITSTKQTSNLN